MANWDDDSPILTENLKCVLREIRDRASRRELLTVDDARVWQKATMAGLVVPHIAYIGGFRGETDMLKQCVVTVGGVPGVPPAQIAEELIKFESRLQKVTQELDKSYQCGNELDADGLKAVLELAAWTHSEWIRIHPFANGNGRTARLWANAILLRYGLPPVVRLRPRPNGGYGNAAGKAMKGDWESTIAVFREMLLNYLNGS